jgi:hypothetical protein
MGIFALQESFDGGDLTKQGPAPRAIDPSPPEGIANLREQGRQPGKINALMGRRSFRGHLDGADQNGPDRDGAGGGRAGSFAGGEGGTGHFRGPEGPGRFGGEYHGSRCRADGRCGDRRCRDEDFENWRCGERH